MNDDQFFGWWNGGDLIVVDLPRVPTGGGGISKDEQPKPEPVAVVSGYYGGHCVILPLSPARIFNANTALYTASLPQLEWQGLTDEEYEAMAEQYVTNYYFDTLKYARAIEAKLKEKNT